MTGIISVTLKEFSARVALSQRHLGRLFKEQTNVSFHQYLRAARLRKAAALLLDASRPLKAIAGVAGYADQSNFNHDFRSAFGLSPGSFRLKRLHGDASVLVWMEPSPEIKFGAGKTARTIRNAA